MIRILALALLLTACTATTTAPPASRGGVGQMTTLRMLALAHCPERLKEAKAVAVLGAGASARLREFIVTAVMEDAKAGAILIKAADSTPETLMLEIRASPVTATTGEMTFREPASGPAYKAVVFRCRGAEVYRIEGADISR